MNCEIILYADDTNSNIFVACDSLKNDQKLINEILDQNSLSCLVCLLADRFDPQMMPPSPAWFAC